MDLRFAFVVVATWPFGMGCSTSANVGAVDGAATPDGTAMAAHAESDAAFEASGLGSGCVAAGGRCQASTIACTATSAYGCGSESQCCFDGVCGPDASSQVIMASSYDQSCTVDKDCVGVSVGVSCHPCDFSCTNAAINAGAMGKYTSDTQNLPAVLAVAHMACPSSCGGPEGVCCLSGTCHRGAPCPFEVLIGVDAAADTGLEAAATDAATDAAIDAADGNAE
jgi:hypothetical protein